MEIENTPLYGEVKAILEDGAKPVNYHWTMQLLAGGKTYDVMKVLSISNNRAYNVNYADSIVVRVVIGSGTFHHRIYPHRADLKAVLFREPIGEVSNAVELTSDIEAQIMRATLVADNSAVMEANRKHSDSQADMDLTDTIEIDIGLTDLALEKIRMISVGGIYRNVTTAELMRHILTVVSAGVTSDEDISIRGVDLYPPSNMNPVSNLVIPHRIRMFEMPDYLNKEVSGVYNAGFGYYLQKKNWYIYPTLDLKRYDNSEKGLTIIRLPPDVYYGSERTYRITSNQVIVLIGDEVKTSDTSELLQLNLGNGLRYSDADTMFDGFGVTANNKTTISRKKNTTEYVIEQRADSINNIQMSPSKITSNAFYESSRMAERLGMYLTCTWEYSDPGSIWPGMPVKYLFMVNGEVYESRGVVQAADHYTRLHQPGITSRRHVNSSSLLLFLGKATLWNN